MNTWYTKNLGDAMLADKSLGVIKTLFKSAYENANSPEGMAIFFRHVTEGHLHCVVKVYFSPSSGIVANAVNAEPCNKPDCDGLGLLAGSDASWLVHFPGSHLMAT